MILILADIFSRDRQPRHLFYIQLSGFSSRFGFLIQPFLEEIDGHSPNWTAFHGAAGFDAAVEFIRDIESDFHGILVPVFPPSGQVGFFTSAAA